MIKVIDLDIHNAENYRATHKKDYDIYMCIPPFGTHINNFLENANYFTEDGNEVILSGISNEKWVISLKSLIKKYKYKSGEPITIYSIMRSMRSVNGIGFTDWTLISSVSAGIKNHAMHVPKEITTQVTTAWGTVLACNNPAVPHGDGDFIVASDADGRPDINDIWVVNGTIFPFEYDMANFPGHSQQTVEHTLIKPKSLYASYYDDSGKHIDTWSCSSVYW